MAIPLAIASSIVDEPMLPVDRAFLHQRMPSGAVFKISVVYDEPFWRADGLSGQSAAPGSPATLTIDACTDTGDPGVMCVITEEVAARRLTQLDPAERKGVVIGELVDRFGDKATAYREFHEQNWTTERYSGGGMISHAGHHVRMDRRCDSLRRARRSRSDVTRSRICGLNGSP